MINTIILDRGHATLDSKGVYRTPGKRFEFSKDLIAYEGYENQKYVEAMAKWALHYDFKVEYTVEPINPEDPALADRVRKANNSINKRSAVYISVHNNAGGGKGQGTEIFTSKGQTLSDTYADFIMKEYKKSYPNRKFRKDTSDGDSDKEENFYVLKNTIMPAVLLEIGFFDNKEDFTWLSNPCNIENIAKATIIGVIRAIQHLYGVDAWKLQKELD